MSSAWALSWGTSWGNSWGSVAVGQPTYAAEIDMSAGRRWYVRRGKKLHIFDRADQADAFIDAQQQAADAVAKAQKTSRRARKRVRASIEVPAPDQTIDVGQLQQLLVQLQVSVDLPALIAQQAYAQVAQLQAIAHALQAAQDEDDAVLMLLLA